MVGILFILLIVVSIAFIFVAFYVYRPSPFEQAPITAPYVQPRLYENILSPEEGEYILAVTRENFTDSIILSGANKNIRNSQTVWLYKSDSFIRRIMERICKITSTRLSQVEPMQVVKYEPGGYYNNHHDSCCDNTKECYEFVKRGGQRKYTMLVYLTDTFTGGYTEFPNLNMKFKPPKLSGLLFHPLEEGGSRCHPLALHRGTPVDSGTKYICNIWIREYDIPTLVD